MLTRVLLILVLNFRGRVGQTGKLECLLDEGGISRALQAVVIDMDGRVCRQLLLAYLIIDTVKNCLLFIDIVLMIQLYINLLSHQQPVDSVGYLRDEGMYDILYAADMFSLALHIIIHLDGATFVFDHLFDTYIVSFLLLIKLMNHSFLLFLHSLKTRL